MNKPWFDSATGVLLLTAIALLLFWPVVIPQIWGLVQNSKLDAEALRLIETSLTTHSGAKSPTAAVGSGTLPGISAASSQNKFCTNCGAQLPGLARFCQECGTRAAHVT